MVTDVDAKQVDVGLISCTHMDHAKCLTGLKVRICLDEKYSMCDFHTYCTTSTGRSYKIKSKIETYFMKIHDLKRLKHECSFIFSSFPCLFLTDMFNSMLSWVSLILCWVIDLIFSVWYLVFLSDIMISVLWYINYWVLFV